MIAKTPFRPSSISLTFRLQLVTRGLPTAVFCSGVPNAAVDYQTSPWSHDMGLVQCRRLGLRGEVRRAPAGRFAGRAPDRELCVRSKSPVARRLRSHSVNFQPHLSKVHTPSRNHLGISQSVLASAELCGLFRWAESTQSTSRKDSGLSCARVAFHRCATHQTVLVRLGLNFQRR
jgi:hypothetical protein